MSGPPGNVEIKISVGLEFVDAVLDQFDFAPDLAVPGRIWFCELLQPSTNHPTLFPQNLIVRLRQRPDNKSDSTMKLRGPSPIRLPSWWDDHDKDEKYEGDWAGSNHQFSASVSHRVDANMLENLDDGPLGTLAAPLFTDHQRDWAKTAVAPSDIHLKQLRPLGPIQARTWKAATHAGYPEEMAAEEWRVDDRGFLELSIRVDWDDAVAQQERFVAFIRGQGFDPDTMQATKTAAMIDYLASRPVAPPRA